MVKSRGKKTKTRGHHIDKKKVLVFELHSEEPHVSEVYLWGNKEKGRGPGLRGWAGPKIAVRRDKESSINTGRTETSSLEER